MTAGAYSLKLYGLREMWKLSKNLRSYFLGKNISLNYGEMFIYNRENVSLI